MKEKITKNEKIFKTIEELIQQAKKDRACKKWLDWARSYSNIKNLVRECPLKYRVWALKKGYVQFKKYCDWNKLTAKEWINLLKVQPQYSKYCNIYLPL